MVSVTQFIAEIVGTTIFMLAIVDLAFADANKAAANSGSIALYIGLGLTISIYITAGLGGYGHLNPIASVVCSANGAINAGDCAALIVAQIIGGLLAFILYFAMGGKRAVV